MHQCRYIGPTGYSTCVINFTGSKTSISTFNYHSSIRSILHSKVIFHCIGVAINNNVKFGTFNCKATLVRKDVFAIRKENRTHLRTLPTGQEHPTCTASSAQYSFDNVAHGTLNMRDWKMQERLSSHLSRLSELVWIARAVIGRHQSESNSKRCAIELAALPSSSPDV